MSAAGPGGSRAWALTNTSGNGELPMADQGHPRDAVTRPDPETGEDCWVGVREVRGRRLLAISRQADGDVEGSLGLVEAARLARALTQEIRP